MDAFVILIIAGIVVLLVAGAIALPLSLVLLGRVRRLEAALREQRPARPLPEAHEPLPHRAAPSAPVAPPVPVTATTAPPISTLPLPPRRPEPAPAARGARWESLEQRLGTRWLNWVGAAVTVLGVAFLLKLLYDQGLIGPAGRVAIGYGIGVAVLWLGERRLRPGHDLLAQAVAATGCATLFLTTYFAHELYGFTGQLLTFVFLCWFALFTVALAVVRRGYVLAVLGLLGAYATPALLSTGRDQAETLFAYLALLATAGTLVHIARGWPGIPTLCLALSCLYYAAWHDRFSGPQRLPVAVAGSLGLTLFLTALALGRSLWRRLPARLEEVAACAAAAVFGLRYSWETLADEHAPALGFVLCGVSLMALAVLALARRRRIAEPLLSDTLLLLAAGALLLVIPACLRAEGEMLAWALGAVLVADMASRSRRLVLGCAAVASLVLAAYAGLVNGVVHTGAFPLFVNRVFVAWLVVAAGWFLVGWRLARAHGARSLRHRAGLGLQLVALVLLLAVLTHEVVAWFDGRARLPGADRPALAEGRTLGLLALYACYPLLWLWAARRRPALWTLAAAHYVLWSWGYLLLVVEMHRHPALGFLNPLFLLALLTPGAVFLVASRLPLGPKLKTAARIHGHLLALALISVEIATGLTLDAWTEASRYWTRLALVSVAWAVYATALLAWGMTRGRAVWRWGALLLLLATLLKVVFVDMAEVRQIWRVLSFLVLGALLMGCSYAYSRHARRRRAAAAPMETNA